MKHQPTELTVENLEELNSIVTSQDFRLAKGIVEGILNTVHTGKPEVLLLLITVKSEGAVYEVSVGREDFAETLEQNLPHYIKQEEYEECRRIVDTIGELKDSHLSTMVLNLIEARSKKI